jgi:hypothetical protein
MAAVAMIRLVAGMLLAAALASPCLAASPGGDTAQYLRSVKAAASGAAAAQPIDPAAEKLATDLAQRYGVTVLRAEPAEADGKPVFRVTVMRQGGDFDNAYGVTTLTVDAASGDLVPQFRNEASGYRLSAPPDRTPRDSAVATTIRRESFRGPGS